MAVLPCSESKRPIALEKEVMNPGCIRDLAFSLYLSQEVMQRGLNEQTRFSVSSSGDTI